MCFDVSSAVLVKKVTYIKYTVLLLIQW